MVSRQERFEQGPGEENIGPRVELKHRKAAFWDASKSPRGERPLPGGKGGQGRMP